MNRYICKEKFADGRIRIKIINKAGRERIGVEHIGVAHNEEELKILQILAQERMKDPRQQELKLIEESPIVEARIIQKASYSKYLHDVIGKIYDGLKFNEIRDEIFRQLVIARIIEPASKLDTIRILSELGLAAPSEKQIYGSLARAKKDYRRRISKACCKFIGIKRATLLLYDVTTLYFEIDKEDAYRKSGFSKDRKLEPQIIVGLLVDRTGFPLSINSFEGNKAETRTIIPVLERFKEENKTKDITVVADAGMLSESNLKLLEESDFKFIVGSRVSKTPYEIKEYRRSENEQLNDGQIFETNQKLNQKAKERRVVYQYSQKRADKDLRTIDKQIKKAQREIEHSKYSRKRKFIKITGIKKELDERMIKEARLKAGIKGYVTNLDCDAQIVIAGYHNLFQVEKSFRMTKSDLQARPIYLQKRDNIEVHLTVCFAALAICRYIQDRTKMSIKKFVQRLKILRTGTIQIAEKQFTAEPEIDVETQQIVKLLKF